MSEPWTPGPWGKWGPSRAGTDKDVWTVTAEGHETVGFAYSVADARLIAAAPEMAALLDEMATPFTLVNPEAIKRARALLARIREDADA